ncbi:hypothetical protein Acid7E03_41080 [Acidisoma sp. 7E03]
MPRTVANSARLARASAQGWTKGKRYRRELLWLTGRSVAPEPTPGEVVGNTISAAMAAGPEAAATWSRLMANNDPVRALAVCKQSVSTNANGRRYCAMSVWLDPPSVPDGK